MKCCSPWAPVADAVFAKYMYTARVSIYNHQFFPWNINRMLKWLCVDVRIPGILLENQTFFHGVTKESPMLGDTGLLVLPWSGVK